MPAGRSRPAGIQQLQVPGIASTARFAGLDVVDTAPRGVVVGVRAEAAAAAVDNRPCLGLDAVGDLAGGLAEFGLGQGGHRVGDPCPDPGDSGAVPAQQALAGFDGIDAAEQGGVGVGLFCLRYKGGRPPKFTLGQRREIKKIAKSKPAEHDLPFSAWSLSKLAEFLVAEGVVGDISHEGLRVLLREEGVTFQRIKTWKTSKVPRYAAKKARVEHLYAIADGEVTPVAGDPAVVFCADEFGPLNLQPRPGRQWAAVSGKNAEPGRAPRPRMRATCTRVQPA